MLMTAKVSTGRRTELVRRLCVLIVVFLTTTSVRDMLRDSASFNAVNAQVFGAGDPEKLVLQRTSLCECPPEWGCVRNSLWRECRGMFPHSAVRENFLRAFIDMQRTTMSGISVQLLPYDFVAGFYLELSYEFYDAQRHLIESIQANSRFCNWWELHGDKFYADRERVFVMFWNYVFYDLNVTCIPEHIYILSYEDVGHSSYARGMKYENGCLDRCVVIPYFTHHSWSDMSRYEGVFDPGERLVASNWTHRSSFVIGSDVQQYLRLRPNMLAFAGSIDRNPTVSRYRDIWRTILANKTMSTSDFSSYTLTANQLNRFSMYRHALFCLCVRGDTSTRAAFYEAILEGCSPVVYRTDLLVYRELFGGKFREIVSKAVIAVPDEVRGQMGDAGVHEILATLEAARSKFATRIRMKALRTLSTEILYADFEGEQSKSIPPAIRNAIQAVLRKRITKRVFL